MFGVHARCTARNKVKIQHKTTTWKSIYHWIFDDCKQIDDICAVSEVLKNLDFSFDFLLFHWLQSQPRRASLW